MGGSVADVITQLERSGDLNQDQAAFIKKRYPDSDLNYEPTHDEVRFKLRGSSLSSMMIGYLDEQEKQGMLSSETKRYVSTLLKLQTPPLDRSNPVQALYTGNGIVRSMGRISPHNLPQFSFNYQGGYNGIWGYATGSREYALLCHTTGLHIIDVTYPPFIFRVQFIPMEGGHYWRDVEIYRHAQNNKTYAYVAAQAGGNLFVVDLSFLSGSTHHLEDGALCPYVDRGCTNFGHTLTVRDGLLFLNSAGTTGNGCQIFDLEMNPWDPPRLSNSYARYNGTQVDCHDSTARNGINVPGIGERNLLYSADGRSGRYRIADITNVRSGEKPVILGETGDLGAGIYAHSSFLSEDSRYLFVFEETNTFDMGVFDVSNPSNISLVTTFSYSDDAARNAIVHNGQVRGQFLFVAYYEAGFRVFDISDPANPVERGKYETYFDAHGTGKLNGFPFQGAPRGAWNVHSFLPSGNILVSDMQSGLFVLQIDETIQPSVSVQPSVSTQPSALIQPSVSIQPSFSTQTVIQPSLSIQTAIQPSLSIQPSISVQPSVSIQPSVPIQPSVSIQPAASIQPSVPTPPPVQPSVSIQPSI